MVEFTPEGNIRPASDAEMRVALQIVGPIVNALKQLSQSLDALVAEFHQAHDELDDLERAARELRDTVYSLGK